MDVGSGSKFHLTHPLPCSFQQTLRITKLSPVNASDIHVSSERVGVRESSTSNTRVRIAVVQAFADVAALLAQAFER